MESEAGLLLGSRAPLVSLFAFFPLERLVQQDLSHGLWFACVLAGDVCCSPEVMYEVLLM